jgi:hypothetical protein
MLTKKTKKSNSKAPSKKQGYDLNTIQTKKATKPKVKNGALHGFFSLMSFVIGIGSIMALIVPMAIHANQGVYIVEPFSCDVWLADYAHLTEAVKENNPKFMQEQLELSLKLTIEDLAEHAECEVK